MGNAPKIIKFPRRQWNLQFDIPPNQAIVVAMPPTIAVSDLSTLTTRSSSAAFPPRLFSQEPETSQVQLTQSSLRAVAEAAPQSSSNTGPCADSRFPLQGIAPTPRPEDSREVSFAQLQSSTHAASPSLPSAGHLSHNVNAQIGSSLSVSPYPMDATPSRAPREKKEIQARQPYNDPIVKSFRGAHAHRKYTYYWCVGDRHLDSPPAIPQDVRVSVGSVFVLKKMVNEKVFQVLQSWLRVSESGQEQWRPLQPEATVNFSHGQYIYSIDGSAPSWATPRSKQKREWERRAAQGSEGTGKRKRMQMQGDREGDGSPSRRQSPRKKNTRA